MSDQEHERPLTRRELRLREQAESEGIEQIDDLLVSDESIPSEEIQATEAPQGADVEVEIDPLNPDGTPRTRREMRELRAAAIAELLAEREADADSDAADDADAADDTDAADDAGDDDADADDADAEHDSYGAPTEALRIEDIPVNGGSEAADESEADLDAPTEAFSLEDILDAAEPTAPTGDAEAVANLFATDDDELESDAEGDVELDAELDEHDADASEAEVEAGADDEAEEPVEVVEVVEVVSVDAEDDDEDDAYPEDPVDAELVSEDPAGDGEDADAADADAAADADDAAGDDDDEEDTSRDTAGYSFPDIKPPEEWRSVFDDPSRAASITAPGDSGDFDDLISRAVAQEGSTGGTGASALILPSHPGDTGGLTGPLGATGELFVTGSIDLPKSMGETGGHSGIHDSIDYDPFLTGESAEPIGAVAESGPMPVSALSAVSARRRPEVPVVAEPTKDRSKVPLVLALSGGGLIVVVVGGVVFAASQGLFG